MNEQRNYRRIPFHTEAELNISETSHSCELIDLALQGALFKTENELPLKIGDQCQLTISLPASDLSMEFTGELIHHRERRLDGVPIPPERRDGPDPPVGVHDAGVGLDGLTVEPQERPDPGVEAPVVLEHLHRGDGRVQRRAAALQLREPHVRRNLTPVRPLDGRVRPAMHHHDRFHPGILQTVLIHPR